jgi:hypothetical protein
VHKKNSRKEDRIKQVLAERGDHPGLVWNFSALQPCITYQPWFSKKPTTLVLKVAAHLRRGVFRGGTEPRPSGSGRQSCFDHVLSPKQLRTPCNFSQVRFGGLMLVWRQSAAVEIWKHAGCPRFLVVCFAEAL